MARQRRDQRRSGVSVTLTQRDQALLRALARFRIARTSDLHALCFPGVRRDTAADRLRRLFDAGFLAVQVQDRAAENVYSLGPEGRRHVESLGGSFGAVPRGGFEHHLAIVRVWVGLAVATHGDPAVRLELFKPDWEIREQGGGQGLEIVPDALVQLRVGQDDRRQVVRLALEVDLGTEWLPTLRRKLHAYERSRLDGAGWFGWDGFGLAIVQHDAGARRAVAVQRLLAEAWGGWSAMWSVPDGPRAGLRALLEGAGTPLTGSPCGEGRDGAPTHDAATGAPARGDHPSEEITPGDRDA